MNNSKRQISLALALISFIMGIAHVLQPQMSSPTGRWSFFFGPIWDAFGWQGVVGYWLLVGAVFLMIFIRSKK